MRTCGLTIVVTVALITSAQAIDCQSRAGTGSGWSWRLIDGKRCWYKGHANINKKRLRWADAAAKPATTGRGRRSKLDDDIVPLPPLAPPDHVPLPVRTVPVPAPGLSFEDRWCRPCLRGE